MKNIATVALLIVLLAGFVIVTIPSVQDIGLHWALFVSHLNMYLPGFGMMVAAGIALAWLDSKKG